MVNQEYNYLQFKLLKNSSTLSSVSLRIGNLILFPVRLMLLLAKYKKFCVSLDLSFLHLLNNCTVWHTSDIFFLLLLSALAYLSSFVDWFLNGECLWILDRPHLFSDKDSKIVTNYHVISGAFDFRYLKGLNWRGQN